MADNSSYRRILKGTAIFGGVQVFQILITLIRGKITAMLIGAQGYGISSLYTSSLAMIIVFAGLGCTVSAVKYIAEQDKNEEKYYLIIRLIEKMFVVIGIVGAITTIVLSAYLSQIAFSSSDYTVGFAVLSVYVFSSLYSSGGYAIYQGMQELKKIAYGNIIPSFLGLLITLPLYALYGIDAVVPVLLVVPVLSSLYIKYHLSRLYKDKLHGKVSNGQLDIKPMVKDLLSNGITSMLPNLLTSVCVLALNMFISRMGNITDIGFYNAGVNITNQYVGLIFSAMAMDYLPRLTKSIKNVRDTNKVVNEQGEIILILSFPLLSLMMLTAPIIITVLLTDEFYVLIDFIRIIAFGTIMKAVAWCMSYMAFAKGEKKVFLTMELSANILMLVANVIGYYFLGLKGLAISYWIFYFIYFVSYGGVTIHRYEYSISKSVIRLLITSLFSLGGLFFMLEKGGTYMLCIATVLVAGICVISIKMLRYRICKTSV